METVETWKWQNGKEDKINEINEIACLKAALHCMKRIRYYSDQISYFEHKLEIARTDDQKAKAKINLNRCKNTNEKVFMVKLECLSERLLELNNPLPSTFEEIKQLLDQLQTDAPLKAKAEKVNTKQIAHVNEYF